MTNPYAVTSSSEQLSHPIHFGGTLTRDDLRMSLYDSPPKRGFGRLAYPILSVLCVVAIILVNRFAGAGEPMGAVLYAFIAFLVLPGWLWLIRLFSPSHRKRVERAEVSAQHQTPAAGWIDDEYFVISDQETAMRAKWSFFGAPFVFPDHIMLPLATDASRRVILPYHFFASSADVRHVLQFVSVKLGRLINQPPKDQHLEEAIQTHVRTPRVNVEAARSWGPDQWPMESDSASQLETTIDLTAKQASARFLVRSVIAVFLFMIWYFLPVWIAVVLWLSNNFRAYGHWGFLNEDLFASVIMLGPPAFIFFFFAKSAVRTISRTRDVQSQPVTITLRDAGIHLSHAKFDSWFTWKAVTRVITDEEPVGWVSKESGEEIRFPRACFESDESIEAFKSKLEQFSSQ